MLRFAHPILERLRARGVRHWLLFDALWSVCRDPERSAREDLDTDIGVDASDFAACREMLLAHPPLPDEVPNGRRSDPDAVSLARTGGRRVVLWRTERRGTARAVAGPPERCAHEYHFCGAEDVAVAGHPVAVPRYAPRLLDRWYGPGWRAAPAPGPLAPHPPALRPVLRVLIDGVFDLFHVGHVRLFARARDLYGHVTAGVHDDGTAAGYKRRPVVPHEHRVEMVRACRYVDAVLPSHPLLTSLGALDALGIDFVLHGAGDPSFLRAYYSHLMAADRFHTLPEFDGYHTTDLIARAGTVPPDSAPPGGA
ncbi:Glycerol-3-phosphate cytidylyltransferase [Gemmata sp. SH-PL17]|uniref:adenylyltransferase/cytidyltransferase family protein n=1 Tax=Gemmata sp. SH-PL17 TaxID=1630693 RepID=UPI00078BC73C|nr:adenylyltransferase/cytidyltransferase family protein [Gemmata sp. SH-PL17]AMV25171.1 Glycerol-3-phosphate cytidylyltransferase [Gemmata sp. SH-PL17]